MAELSVVVPFFNVEAYLGAALDSIARQTLSDIEVIMVDDGSTDGTAVIAKSFADRDPRFRLIQQANAGLGPARNAGVRHATGTYLAFADGDDLLDPYAYELLVGSLRETGSDIACGGVRRVSKFGVGPSWLHVEPFRQTIRRTHVSRYPDLLQDRTAWNKVFRRSFWDAHDLMFPGTLYEDGPVTIRAHVFASAVDVFHDVVYYWRVRDSGGFSITQRARDLSNVEDRMASVNSVGSFLAAQAPELKPVYDQSVLTVDMAMLIGAYEVATDAERARLTELAAAYLLTVDESVYPRVSALLRLHYYLLRAGMNAELLEVLRYAKRGDAADVATQPGGPDQSRWYAAYPYFRDASRGIPDDVYDITDEMRLRARLDAVTWRAGLLRIEGHAYIERLTCATPGDCDIRVSLCNSRTKRTIRLPVQRVRRPDVTARNEQIVACYDWSGFVVEVQPQRLATMRRIWRAASWELRIEVSAPGMRREGPVTAVAPGSAQWPPGRWIGRHVWIQPAPERDGRFFIRGRRVGALVTSCVPSGGELEIAGWAAAKLGPDAALMIAPQRGGGEKIEVPVRPGPPARGRRRRGGRGRTVFRARLPVQRMIAVTDAAGSLDPAVHVHDEVTWDISVAPGGGRGATRLTVAPGTAGARVSADGREVTAIGTHFGYLSVLVRTARPVVTHLEWTDGRLIMRGDCTDPGLRPAELLLRHSESGDDRAVPVSWADDGFTAELTPARMPGIAGELPLASGNWNLLVRTGDGDEVTVAAARDLLPSLPGYHRIGIHEIEPQPYRADALRLNVRLALADDERGRYALRRLHERAYPHARASSQLRDLVVFDSFGGLQYACNPRAIYEQLRRSHPELDCAWVSKDGQFTVPDGGRVVIADSRAHYELLAQARFIVTNNLLPDWYEKRDGQFCLQTWHGTPLKHIGLQIAQPRFSNAVIYKDLLRRAVAAWDVLLSPNAFSTPVFRQAFGFHGEILEAGSPRNDLLYSADQADRSEAVRRRLGLPVGKRVVLYAPTWRDDAFQQNGRYRFELELELDAMSRALGDDHIVLLRLHTNVRNGGGQGALTGPNAADVTRYPDIADLYLVSDVLITDYSSAMFDFACTGRPMLFFTYDLERYRDQLRGFYFDFEAQAPGPLLCTTDAVIEALRDIDQVARSYHRAYQAFALRFCALEDGHAAERAVDRIAGP